MVGEVVGEGGKGGEGGCGEVNGGKGGFGPDLEDTLQDHTSYVLSRTLRMGCADKSREPGH